MFKTAKAKKRRFSDVLNVFKRFSNNSKTPPSKIEHKNEIARKTEDILISRAIFLTLQFSFTFPILSHSTQNITHFRHFLLLPIQFNPFPPLSTFLRFPCQLTQTPVHFSSRISRMWTISHFISATMRSWRSFWRTECPSNPAHMRCWTGCGNRSGVWHLPPPPVGRAPCTIWSRQR